MKRSDVVKKVLQQNYLANPLHDKGLAFAPTNIALCKYWGKRDRELNLPMTSSLSIALQDKGALTSINMIDQADDVIILNGLEVPKDTAFVKRTREYLDLFRGDNPWHVQIDIKMDIPVAAGLASSACGFASLVAALNDAFGWELSQRHLSILARLGSGSAARSLWNGFVEWHAGAQQDGMDCFAEPMNIDWPHLCVGILKLSEAEKAISSRDAMQRTVDSSILYQSWPKKVAQDLVMLKQALHVKNFTLLGGVAESNALSMHGTIMSSWPPVCYFLPETIAAMHFIWQLRAAGLDVYFTQDAGPNLKLLFMEKDIVSVKENFPQLEVIRVFD